MKFEYDVKEYARKCVAYIDCDGGLCINVGQTHSECKVVCIDPDGFFHFNMSWEPDNRVHKFYLGDKITITF